MYREQTEVMQSLFWVVKTINIAKPFITVGLTSAAIIYAAIADTDSAKVDII